MNAPLALALVAGMVGAVNPCGFSLLPAYIGFFVSGEGAAASLDRRLLRAVTSAAAVTVGFVVVFVFLGVLLESIANRIRPDLPWVTIAIGAVVICAGTATVLGRRIRVPMPALRSLPGRTSVAMMTYGAFYALASLSCTIGPFLAITTLAINRSLIGGLATYVAYATGMGTVILVLATTAALARPGPTRKLRHLARHAGRVGGLLMILSGGYAIWYARWELAVYRGDFSNDPIVDAGERIRRAVIQTIEAVGAIRLGLFVAAVLSTLIVLAHTHRRVTENGAERPG